MKARMLRLLNAARAALQWFPCAAGTVRRNSDRNSQCNQGATENFAVAPVGQTASYRPQ